MNTHQNFQHTAEKKEPNILPPTEVVENPNPKANENINVANDKTNPEKKEPDDSVGSEITDGEDA